MTAHFRVEGRVAGREGATMEIDRERGLVTVRPMRSRETYVVTLAIAADMIVWRAAKDAAPTKYITKRR